MASCSEIAFGYGSVETAALFYPQCAADVVRNWTVDGMVAVWAKDTGMPENISASLGINFGMMVCSVVSAISSLTSLGNGLLD